MFVCYKIALVLVRELLALDFCTEFSFSFRFIQYLEMKCWSVLVREAVN